MANTMYRILGKRGRITIPYEMRQRVGFAYNDVLSFTESEDGRTVLVRREKICNHCNTEPPGRQCERGYAVGVFGRLNRFRAARRLDPSVG